jgi:hypothetical protein
VPEVEVYLTKKRPSAQVEKYFDKETFDWKIFGNRHKKYESIGIYEADQLAGIAVYFIDTPKSCNLIWIDTAEPSTLTPDFTAGLLNHLFKVTRRRCIYAWSPMLGFQRRAFKRNGFLMNPTSKGSFSSPFSLIELSNERSMLFDHWRSGSNYNFQGIMLD